VNLADFFLLFRRGTLTVASTVDLVRSSKIYHTRKPHLFTTHWPWRTASSYLSQTYMGWIGLGFIRTMCRILRCFFDKIVYWTTIWNFHRGYVLDCCFSIIPRLCSKLLCLFVIAYVVIVNSNEYWLLSSVIVQHIQTHGFSNGTCGYLKHGVTKDAFIALHTAVGVRKYCD